MTDSLISPLEGRRLRDGAEGDGYESVQPGDYWKPAGRPEGEWWFRDPVGNIGRVSKHTVAEHEDGTITVTPSIADEGEATFHGWLTKGVWTW